MQTTPCLQEFMEQHGIQKELDAYLKQIEEAELRDHRKIGKDLKLFHFQDDAPGWYFGIQMVGKFILNLKDTLERCNQITNIKKLKHHK